MSTAFADYDIKLTKNHKKALSIDCKKNLKKEYTSISKCKQSLTAAIRKEGELIGGKEFEEVLFSNAESNCKRRIKKGLFAYNSCLAEVLEVEIIIDPPPVVIEPPEKPSEEGGDGKVEEPPTKVKDPGVLNDADAIYNIIAKATYFILAQNNSDGVQGSAVAIKNNLLATNCHIVYKKNKTTNQMTNVPWPVITVINIKDDYKTGKNWIDAKIYKADRNNDRCIVKANINALPVQIKNFEKIKMWEKVFATGNPNGYAGVMTPGKIENKFPNGWIFHGGSNEEYGFDIPLLQTNAAIRGGSSGGGLYDMQGRLLGITTLGDMDLSAAHQMNIAVSADEFIKLLNQ